ASFGERISQRRPTPGQALCPDRNTTNPPDVVVAASHCAVKIQDESLPSGVGQIQVVTILQVLLFTIVV
ncbi:MAG TPA: hypothetical protein VED87_05040, partial [Methylocystis sp.]|nr:hypothetical protein [Methylocystis sp.]